MSSPNGTDDAQGSPAVDIYKDVLVRFAGEADHLCVSSHVLGLASPVFHAMLTSGMAEERNRCVEIAADIGTKEQFREFYGFLLPAAALKREVREDNVDGLLAFSDYYQVSDVKDACERFLLEEPVSVDRLIQAEMRGIYAQRRRCVESLAADPRAKLSQLEAHPKLLLEVACRAQQCVLESRDEAAARIRKRIAAASQRVFAKIPCTVRTSDGSRLDEFARDAILLLEQDLLPPA